MGIKPLKNIRVLDLTQDFCGPVCTQYLADLGAEIIKIESPEGDVSRRQGRICGDTSLAYIHLNRGKKSVVLDITQTAQKDIFLRLAGKADMIIEDLGPGRADALGIGYKDVLEKKPDMLYLSISNFGQKGTFRDVEANDAILQAISGYMSLTSMTYQGKFTKLQPRIADLMTGVYAAIGALAAVIHRKKTGESLFVDISKLSCMLQCLPDGYAKYMSYGEKGFPTGNAHRMSAAFYPMPAKDGAIICNPDNRSALEKKWENFCEAIGIPEEVYSQEKFNSYKGRLDHRSEVEELLNTHTCNFTVAELEQICRKNKIAAGVMNDVKQLTELPQTLHDEIIINLHDEKNGDFRVLGSPLKYSGFETREDTFVDSLGAHTEEVLAEVLA